MCFRAFLFLFLRSFFNYFGIFFAKLNFLPFPHLKNLLTIATFSAIKRHLVATLFPLPDNHEQRFKLHNEVHARSWATLELPVKCSHLALLLTADEKSQARAHLNLLCDRFGVTAPNKDADHFSAKFNSFQLRWEQHAEFISYTFYVQNVQNIADEPFERSALEKVPVDWLDDLPGKIMVAAHATVMPAIDPPLKINEISKIFADNPVVGSKVSGAAAEAFTDFRIHVDGFSRFLILEHNLKAQQAGRLLKRLFEIEVYRVMALLAFPLAKKLIPDLESYSLGKLCKTLCIPMSNRHRAEGDAMATVKLFKLLIDKDSDKEIIKSNIKLGIEKELPSKLQTILDEIPSKTGVFYAHKENGDILYIGEGKDMKKSVNKLFFKTSKKGQLLQKLLNSVTYEECGNGLISKLKYYNELLVNKPKFNFYLPKKVEDTTFSNPNLMIIDKGRHTGEKSVILVENDILLGYCFVDLAYQIEHADVLKSLLTPIENSQMNRHVFKTYLQKNRVEKIVRF